MRVCAAGPERVREGTAEVACGERSLGISIGSELASVSHEGGVEDGEDAAVVTVVLSWGEV